MDLERPRSLKTLHLNTERTWRGGEQMTLNLMDGLRERGHTAHLLAQPRSPMAENARRAGHPVFELKMWADGDVIAMFHIARLLRRERYDLIHLHTPHAHTLGGLAALAARPRPLRVVNKRTDFSIFRNSFFRLNHLKYNHFADAIIAVSERVREVLVGDGVRRERVHCVHSGIDFARFDAADPEALRRELGLAGHPGPVVGHVAHFSDHKGQEHLVRALPLILRRHPRAVFFLVGEGPLRPRLQELARELGAGEAARFPGFREDVPALLKLFDVFVMPSLDEGLCSSILDAHACRVPVVASAAGGIPEIVEESVSGLLVPPEDPEAIAAAVCRLLEDRVFARRLAGAGRKVVEERFSSERMVEGTLAVYRQWLEARELGEGPAAERAPVAWASNVKGRRP